MRRLYMLIRKLLLTLVLGIASTQGWASCSMKCTKAMGAGVDSTKLKGLTEDVKKCISNCPLKDTKNFTCALLAKKFEHPSDKTALLEMLLHGPGEEGQPSGAYRQLYPNCLGEPPLQGGHQFLL